MPSSSAEDLSADTDQLLRDDDGVYDKALSDTEVEDGGNHELETRTVNRRARSQSNSSSRQRHNIGNIGGRLTEAQLQQKNLLQVMLLEAGILFHSVFIGMALSVATGSNFVVLLIAITFHQTFEGLALGSRIAGLKAFDNGSWKPWLMCLAYGTTTPIGQAIGLATRKLYDPASQTGLLMVGIMNAISSGLLLFAGLVELLAEDFLSDESYVVLTGKRRYQACGAVAAGGFGMALIGAWA
jgi:zinc transporter 1/2/3